MAVPTQYGDSTKYLEWSLDAAEVPVNDTNVGCCFTLDAAAVAACNRADGLDCLPTLADGTAVARELRNFSQASSTGIQWFQIPVVSTVTGGTVMYIQLGGATVNVANSTAVWQNMYGGACTWSVVSHADDDVNDSGTTGNHGTFNGSAAYGTTSPFGYEAIQVSGDSDYTSFPHHANLAGGNGTTDNARTVLAWVKPTNYTVAVYVAIKGIATGTVDYMDQLSSAATKKQYCTCRDGAVGNARGRLCNTSHDDSGAWTQFGFTYTGSTPLTNCHTYRSGAATDDTQYSAGGYTAMHGDSDVLAIGRYDTAYSSMAWCVFRIGQFVLSANQILGSYNIESQAATNGAFTVGALTDFVAGAVTITDVSPSSGDVGTTVTITGTGFGAAQGAGYVLFGTTSATVSSWADTSIDVAAPDLSGTVDVTVYNNSASHATKASAYTYSYGGMLKLVYGGTTVYVALPLVGYTTTIDLPFEIVRLDNGKYASYDHVGSASAYDRRRCDCIFHLDATDAGELLTFLKTTARGVDCTISMPVDSGFYPFGPDKGNRGPFTVAAELLEYPGQLAQPFKHHQVRVRFTNTGSWPAFTAAAQTDDGDLAVGTVTGLRMPVNWYAPVGAYGEWATRKENTSVAWLERGASSVWYTTAMEMLETNGNLAALLTYLLGTARAGTFTLTPPASHYVFGSDNGAGPHTVRWVQNSIDLLCEGYNRWRTTIELGLT